MTMGIDHALLVAVLGLTFFSRQLATAKFANAASVNKAKTRMDVQDDVHR